MSLVARDKNKNGNLKNVVPTFRPPSAYFKEKSIKARFTCYIIDNILCSSALARFSVRARSVFQV